MLCAVSVSTFVSVPLPLFLSGIASLCICSDLVRGLCYTGVPFCTCQIVTIWKAWPSIYFDIQICPNISWSHSREQGMVWLSFSTDWCIPWSVNNELIGTAMGAASSISNLEGFCNKYSCPWQGSWDQASPDRWSWYCFFRRGAQSWGRCSRRRGEQSSCLLAGCTCCALFSFTNTLLRKKQFKKSKKQPQSIQNFLPKNRDFYNFVEKRLAENELSSTVLGICRSSTSSFVQFFLVGILSV